MVDINNLVPTVKFTKEEEFNNKLPFLDVMICKEEINFQYKIFRKLTNNLMYVHYYSFHSNIVKKSTFRSMFLRALRIVSPKYLDEEFNYIYNIGRKLCYPDHFLDNCLYLAKKSYYNTIKPNFSMNNILCIPYHPLYEHMSYLLRHLNINLVFKYSTIKNKIICNNPNKNGVVYKIPCKDCNQCYVGQSGKPMEVRISQHKYNVRTCNESSAIFSHMVSNDHVIEWEGACVIKYESDYISRNIFESTCIQYLNTFNLNGGLYKIDQIIKNSIVTQNKNVFNVID